MTRPVAQRKQGKARREGKQAEPQAPDTLVEEEEEDRMLAEALAAAEGLPEALVETLPEKAHLVMRHLLLVMNSQMQEVIDNLHSLDEPAPAWASRARSRVVRCA